MEHHINNKLGYRQKNLIWSNMAKWKKLRKSWKQSNSFSGRREEVPRRYFLPPGTSACDRGGLTNSTFLRKMKPKAYGRKLSCSGTGKLKAEGFFHPLPQGFWDWKPQNRFLIIYKSRLLRIKRAQRFAGGIRDYHNIPGSHTGLLTLKEETNLRIILFL